MKMQIFFVTHIYNNIYLKKASKLTFYEFIKKIYIYSYRFKCCNPKKCVSNYSVIEVDK